MPTRHASDPSSPPPAKPAVQFRPAGATGDADPKKSDQTRSRILNAAAYVLSREGYAHTKLADIAKLAELKISTLYYYYASREELVLAVLLAGNQHVLGHTTSAVQALPASASALERVLTAVEAHLRHVLEISHFTEATIRNTGQLPEPLREQISEAQAKYGRFWQKLIDDAAEGDPAYRTTGARHALRLLIIGALNWTVEWWTPGRSSVDEVVDTALTLTRRTLSRTAG